MPLSQVISLYLFSLYLKILIPLSDAKRNSNPTPSGKVVLMKKEHGFILAMMVNYLGLINDCGKDAISSHIISNLYLLLSSCNNTSDSSFSQVVGEVEQ